MLFLYLCGSHVRTRVACNALVPRFKWRLCGACNAGYASEFACVFKPVANAFAFPRLITSPCPNTHTRSNLHQFSSTFPCLTTSPCSSTFPCLTTSPCPTTFPSNFLSLFPNIPFCIVSKDGVFTFAFTRTAIFS